MTTKHTPATPLPWHVNAIDSKRGRITGDETSQGWDKLDVHGANANVARVYRTADVRFIAHAANAYPQLVEEVRGLRDYCRAAVRRVRGKADKAHYGARADLADTILRSLGEDA